jgi:hypothetical protein
MQKNHDHRQHTKPHKMPTLQRPQRALPQLPRDLPHIPNARKRQRHNTMHQLSSSRKATHTNYKADGAQK